MNRKCQYNAIYCAAGTACCLCGLITIAFWWDLYNGIVLKHLPLSQDSETFRLWSSSDLPLYINVYLFNWTNAEATISNEEKPALQQVGPYVYRLEMYKKDFVWNDNDTLTYTMGQRFFYSPELTRGDPAVDVVTIPNLLLMGMKYKLETSPSASRLVRESVSWTLENVHPSEIYVQKTVAELLFDGYDDQLLQRLNEIKLSIEKFRNLSSSTNEFVAPKMEALRTLAAPLMGDVSQVLDAFFSPLRKVTSVVINYLNEEIQIGTDEAETMFEELQEVPKRFPGLVAINDTRENTLNVYAGNMNMKKFGLVHACSYRREHPVRGSGSCGCVPRSSMGDFWPVDIAEGESASVFVPDLCSALRLNNAGRHVVNGIEGIRFESTRTTLDDRGTLNCAHGDCSSQSSGVRNLSTCLKAPLFASMPHFYAANASFQNAVQGLKPDKNLHAFHLTLQKEYGVLLHGSIRLQLNVQLQNFTVCCSPKGGVPNVVFPILWFEMAIDLPTAMADKLYFAFATVPLVFKIFGRLLFVLGLLIVVFTKYSFS